VVDAPGPATASVRKLTIRPAWAEIDLSAVRHNARLLQEMVAPALLCVVVKADGYGHGAVSVARAALDGGAAWLAVATVEEGVELREAGLSAPALLLSEPPPDAMETVVASSIVPTLYSGTGVRAAQDAAARLGRDLDVHVKVDTGMHRVGARPDELVAVASAVRDAANLRFAALWTHLAVADGMSDEDRGFTSGQLARFAELRHDVAEVLGRMPMAHAANSAAAICLPESRLEAVRCGIALYGSLPSPALRDQVSRAVEETRARSGRGGDGDGEASAVRETKRVAGLAPAMSLRAEVSHVQVLEADERPSYGRLYRLEGRSVVATVPLGYADGIPRRFFDGGGTVLIRGRRCRLAGAVTMDQIVVDCGADTEVSVGDEVVLIGEQGGESVTAWDWAEVLGTISYEVLARIGPRVPRVYVDGSRKAP
jgi:alanine racemase